MRVTGTKLYLFVSDDAGSTSYFHQSLSTDNATVAVWGTFYQISFYLLPRSRALRVLLRSFFWRSERGEITNNDAQVSKSYSENQEEFTLNRKLQN